jgi:hypothetical protein
MTDQRRGTVREGAAARSRTTARAGRPDVPDGPHLGPIPVSATGVLLTIALIGSLLFFAYVITVRDATQIPLLAAGAVVLGIVFVAIAIVGGRATWRSSVSGRDARAFGHALVGGVAALVAAGCFAGAIVLFLLQGSIGRG